MDSRRSSVTFLVAFLVWTLAACGESFEPELVRSFLSRPWMLTNASIHEPKIDRQKGQVIMSLYVDNWSPYLLRINRNKMKIIGELSKALPPRDLPAKGRVLALRSMNKGGPDTKGMACWDLIVEQNEVKVSKLCVAWDVGNKNTEIALSIGQHSPSFQKIWMPKPPHNPSRQMWIEKTRQLDNTVYVGHHGLAVVAANLSMPEGETLHYRLTMSVLPPNIDVWGWVKYYRNSTLVPPTPEAVSNPAITTTTEMSTSGSTSKLPETTKKMVIKDTITPMGEEKIQTPIFSQKHLLDNGKALETLERKGMNIYDALKATKAQTVVGILVENWLSLPLSLPRYDITSGQLPDEKEAAISAPAPGIIPPGSQDFGVILQKSVLSGTSGVVRWTIGNTDKVLSVMWSIPYNRHFWRTWLAVALTTHGPDMPTYKELYSKTDSSRFIRRRAGKQFEFSDGTYLIVARMDGGATTKPVLHLSITPLEDEALAVNVRKQAGIKPDLRSATINKTRNPRKQNDSPNLPTYGQVQGHAPSSGSSSFRNGGLASLEIVILALIFILKSAF